MQLEEYKRRAGRGERIAAGSDAHLFMHGAAEEARRITCEMNNAFHTAEELRALFAQLTGEQPGEGFALFSFARFLSKEMKEIA